MADQHAPDWWHRNWKWLVPVGVLTMLALMGVFIGGIFMAVHKMIVSSEPYRAAVAAARASPAAQQALGTPIAEGWLVLGEMRTRGPTGTADLSIPLSGPDGDGRIDLAAEKQAGAWRIDVLVLVVDESEQRIDLLAQGAEADPRIPSDAKPLGFPVNPRDAP